MDEQIIHLPIEALRESPFNPRKTFDPEALQKLAWTIEMDGVLQPLEVRPIPGQIDNAHARERYEIVFGHRRYRASQLAKRETVPCIVRERTDEEAARVQLVENIQRDDVNPLEQAQAMRDLMDKQGMKAEDVGAHVGKSRAWVYAQLKLLQLTPELQAEVASGRMASEVAQQVATVHPKLQADFVKQIQVREYRDGKMQPTGDFMGTREVKRIAKMEFMRDLKAAPFDRADAGLRPGWPSCDTCHRCTGNDPDLVERYGPDACTDPDCYGEKARLHVMHQVDAYRAQGLRVIEGDEAKKLAPYGWLSYSSGWVDVDTIAVPSKEEPRTLADGIELMGDDAPQGAVFVLEKGGEINFKLVITTEDESRVRAFLHADKDDEDRSDDGEPEQDNRPPEVRAVDFLLTWAQICKQLVRRAIAQPTRTLDELRLVAHALVEDCYELPDAVVEAYGWREELNEWCSADDDNTEENWAHNRIEQMTADEIGALMVAFAISAAPFGTGRPNWYEQGLSEKLALCRAYGVDPLDPERAEPLPTPSTAARAAEDAPAEGQKPKRTKDAKKAASANANGELDLVGGDMHPELGRKVEDEPATAGEEMSHEPASPAGEVLA